MASDREGRQSRSITLVGFMGAGKSRIGRALAERLGIPFVDTDSAIEASKGMSVADIFATEGEDGFRAAERDTIVRLLDGEPKVIALGGGAFIDPATRDRLNAASRTIWLDPPFDVLLARLARSGHRPLADGRSGDELRLIWERRRDGYAKAHLRIATGDGDPQGYANDIIALLT